MYNKYMEIIAQRQFNLVYIYIDIAFLVLLCGLLIFKKKYLTLLFGLFGGILYFAVDYGIFHLLTHSRHIEGGNMFLVLLWMSFSYGITNFVWIWLSFTKDKRLIEWIALIWIWWLAAPLIASTFGKNSPVILIQRTTGAYHGVMAAILFLGYAFAIIWNLSHGEKSERFPLLWLLAVGISVQFAWEFSLLIGGIRSAAITDWGTKIITLITNSLLETNLGAVPIFCISTAITAKINEDLTKRDTPLSFTERLKELNSSKKPTV